MLPWSEVLLSGLVLGGISTWVWLKRRVQAYLVWGWLWYIAMLIPVSGLLKSGISAHADRYTYLPQIGLYLAITWWIADRTASSKHWSIATKGASIGVILLLGVGAWMQT